MYDAGGNTLTYSNVTLTYNDRGRANTVAVGAKKGSSTETLVYNALGQLIETSGGAAGTVLYTYDESGHLIGEYSASGGLIEETAWLGDIPIATLRPSGSSVTVYYVHSDHLNSPRAVTRPSDNKQMWNWFSDPFGTTAANSNPQNAGAFPYNLRFPGQIYDPEAGVHQNYFRDYDPAIGRYVESDPIGLKGGINTYAYAAENPLMTRDPLGLDAFQECVMQQAAHPTPNAVNACANAFAQSLAQALANLCRDALTCTARCALEKFVGKDFADAVEKSYEEMGEKVMEHIAKTVENQAIRRGVPVAGEVMTLIDAGKTFVCTVDCVKSTRP